MTHYWLEKKSSGCSSKHKGIHIHGTMGAMKDMSSIYGEHVVKNKTFIANTVTSSLF